MMTPITEFVLYNAMSVGMMDQPQSMPGREMGWGMGWGMGFGVLWIILLLVIAVLLGALLFRQLSKRDEPASEDRPANRDEDPLEIAKRRHAKGEIDQEEFKRLKRELDA